MDVLDEIIAMLDNNRKDFNLNTRVRPVKLRSLSRGVIEPPNAKSFIEAPSQTNKKVEDASLKNEASEKIKFSHITLTLPVSSTIQTAEYYPKKQYLIVSFKSGGSYSYTSVDFEVIRNWMNASSAGSFFYYNIRKSYRYRKM